MTEKFDFNDILIVPKIKTHINSRYKDITLPQKLPLFTAPMDTVVDEKNINIFLKNNINVVLPRTVKYNKTLVNDILDKTKNDNNIFISFGFDDLDNMYNGQLSKDFNFLHKNANILIDVANGHMQKNIDYAKEIKRLRTDVTIMVGNIGNPQSYEWYAKQECVDYIRVGIGNGGGCLTTKNSGVGYPMASLINETFLIKKQLKKENNIKKLPIIVADGGMKDYSDIIKAFALGAERIMLGSIFNKAIESSGENYLYGIKLNEKWAKYFFKKKYPVKKYFRGMSTKEVQKKLGKSKINTSEGIVIYRNIEYFLSGWIENFKHYLRNQMSYCNAKTMEEFIGNVKFIKITKNAYDRFNK